MTSVVTLQNKIVVWKFWQELNESKVDGLAKVIHRYVDDRIVWHGPHPLNDLVGAESLIASFWQPFMEAFPDLSRRCEISIGGHEHWIGAIAILRA